MTYVARLKYNPMDNYRIFDMYPSSWSVSHWFCHRRNLNRSGVRWWRTRVQTDGSSPLIVDHFGGEGFAQRIVTLELTSFARSGFAGRGRTSRRGRGRNEEGRDWRKSEKRNKGPIKTNWSSSRRTFVHRPRAPSRRFDKFCGPSAKYTLTYMHSNAHICALHVRGETRNLVEIYRGSCAWRVISGICWMRVQTWWYVSLINADEYELNRSYGFRCVFHRYHSERDMKSSHFGLSYHDATILWDFLSKLFHFFDDNITFASEILSDIQTICITAIIYF